MNYNPDKQRLQGWQWALDRANPANGERPTLEEYIAARMNEVADSYNAQRLAEAREQPEIQALVDKLAAVDKAKLADIEAAIDAAAG
jgi:hypothetical protein